MKQFSALVLALMMGLPLGAQTMNVREIVAADRCKAAGCEGPYRYDAAPLSPSPKGYEPFYVSHYGRHGSRYAWNDDTYRIIFRVLEDAKRADALTETGKIFYDRYMAFYKVPLMNYGDLTELGAEQHASIAEAMVEEFPEIFAKGGKFLAMSSESRRAITSMAAFCASLERNAPKAEVTVNSLHTNMTVINPPEAPDELVKEYEGKLKPIDRGYVTTLREKHYDNILDRLFTNRRFLEETGGRSDFLFELFMFWSGYHNYCSEDLFEFLFTPEETVDLWEAENCRLYISHSSDRYLMIPLLEDIIAGADAAIDGTGEYKGHFRFGHDTVLNALIPLLDINGGGYQPDKAEDVKYWFQNYNVPKAANIQFILYRSKKGGDILFKLLLNNSEVALPQLTAVNGPYYRWDDFKAWAESLCAAHPRTK